MTIEADVHAAIRTAVPLPGNLPAWTPSAVFVDGKPEVSLRRDKNYLWIVVPEGVHKIRVEGVLSGADEWQWTFALKPRQVTIEAPEWTVSGVRSDGVPEQQIFFVRKDKSTAGQAQLRAAGIPDGCGRRAQPSARPRLASADDSQPALS